MRFLVALGVIFSALVLSPISVEPLDAAEADSSSRRIVAVIEVSGLIDPIEISYIESQLEQAQSKWRLSYSSANQQSWLNSG